ncbi:MAG: AAA family ATPase [Anaerolineae bacterium]|nr:AAA family ATPase [Anaerolineae bacterium]
MGNDARTKLLMTWGNSLAQAAIAGALTGDAAKPLHLRAIETVRGPRAGALEVDAGLDAGALLNVLTKNDYAIHRQFVPWAFTGDPSVYMAGRSVRLEAGWPDDLAEKDIPLKSLGRHPDGNGRWIVGKNEVGATVTLGLDDAKPHYLFGGFTGSGKTWALRSAVKQLADDADNHFVLCDGKFGDGLGCLRGISGLVGPLALDIETTRAALAWAVGEMRRRYETGAKRGRVIVVIDEVQEFTQDAAIAEMLRRLTAQGRGARVHVLVGTQNPLQSTFNDPSIKRNLTGRLALRTDSFEASKVVVGGASPRADHLLGAGDAYALTPSATHRVQVAYIPERELQALRNDGAELDEWPEFDPEAAGTLPEANGNCFEVNGIEAAVAILAAALGKGRPSLQKMVETAVGSKPGSMRAKRLLDLGRAGWDWLQAEGWALYDADPEAEDDANLEVEM